MILETAYSRGLIKDSAEWLKMLRLRNDETHQYNKEAAIELCKAIPEFIKYFDDLASELKNAGYNK